MLLSVPHCSVFLIGTDALPSISKRKKNSRRQSSVRAWRVIIIIPNTWCGQQEKRIYIRVSSGSGYRKYILQRQYLVSQACKEGTKRVSFFFRGYHMTCAGWSTLRMCIKEIQNFEKQRRSKEYWHLLRALKTSTRVRKINSNAH